MKKVILCVIVLIFLLLSCKEDTVDLTENVQMTDTRYQNIPFVETTEGEFFSFASKNQHIFPITFENGNETVTVNAPIFTGIKTKNAYTYKNYFAFQESQVVIPVLTKYNDQNNVTRYLLIDKEGNLIDDNFNRSCAVADIASISKNPSTLDVVQIGEFGAYEQYLATTDGEVLSEKFDEIGFFYNGISIVRKGDKIGFISDEGDTLLEPSIEIDDLRYTPDYNRPFQVKYMTDDAFIVSIGGELAIITLDRAVDAEQYVVTLPFDFSKEPYAEPEITPTNEFVWGDYMPFVVYTKDNLDDPIPIFALLGEGVTTLDEGHKVYEKLNNLYLTTYPVPEGDYSGISYSEERISDYLFGSNIINMSEDLEKMEVWRVVDFENSKAELDVYQKGVLVSTTNYDTWYRTNARVRDESTGVNISFDGLQATRSYDHTDNKQSYQVHKKSELLYEVVFELEEHYNVVLNQIIDETHLLLTFINHSDTPITSNPNDNGISRNTYLFSAEEKSLTKVENYIANPLMSPDGKYLIYSSFKDRNASANPPDNWAYVMKAGFYVKNLENGQTTFYPFDCDWNPAHDALCWISKEAYYKEID